MDTRQQKNVSVAEIFSSRLGNLRQSLSKRAFAKKLGINPQTYQHYESGRVPDSDTLSRIASECSVSVDWLLGRDPSDVAPMAARDHHHVDYGTPPTIHGASARSALIRQEGEKRQSFAAQDEARLIEFWKVVESVTPLMLRGGANVETCQQMIRAALDDFTAWCKAIGSQANADIDHHDRGV